MQSDRDSLWHGLVSDGRPLLMLTGSCIILAGIFALFLGLSGQFLPHDVQFLGMTPEALCAVNECRIVHFMIHDRISFAGALVAIGLMYWWLTAFPLRQGQWWAWKLTALSGVCGFGTFLAYLGYGYLDTWHGLATLGLLPTFVIGLFYSAKDLRHRNTPQEHRDFSLQQKGRCLLLASSLGLMGAGSVILTIGMTCVFVPQDLAFMGVTVSELQALNPRLVPLIAHDRAGFGGAVAVAGLLMAGSIYFSPLTRALWQTLLLAGTVGFGTAVGVHPAVGYNDVIHVAPAVIGMLVFAAGIVMTGRGMFR